MNLLIWSCRELGLDWRIMGPGAVEKKFVDTGCKVHPVRTLSQMRPRVTSFHPTSAARSAGYAAFIGSEAFARLQTTCDPGSLTRQGRLRRSRLAVAPSFQASASAAAAASESSVVRRWSPRPVPPPPSFAAAIGYPPPRPPRCRARCAQSRAIPRPASSRSTSSTDSWPSRSSGADLSLQHERLHLAQNCREREVGNKEQIGGHLLVQRSCSAIILLDEDSQVHGWNNTADAEETIGQDAMLRDE